MFNLLTKYLLQYKKVSLPSVGTIRLLQQPAQFNVADKTILPPFYTVEVHVEDAVSEHQLNFLSLHASEEKESVRQSLEELGLKLKEKIEGEGFFWRGIGVVRRGMDTATKIPNQGLEPVVAERLIRQDAEHRMLVGNQHLTSTQIAGLRDEPAVKSQSSMLIIIGWIILLLSVAYIIYVLWQGGFRMQATGSKRSPIGFVQAHKPETTT